MSHDHHSDELEPMSSREVIISYLFGFILSVALTLLSFWIVINQWLQNHLLVAVLLGLAIIQMIVQVVCFLHIGHETKPRWNLLAFLFMTQVVLILVAGSLWIMTNLDNRVMPAANMEADYHHGHER